MTVLAGLPRFSWPWAGSGHGPLPVLLVMLTGVTGLVDAVSYVALGHVFVANMTGNVVFVGFAAAGAPGLSLAASLTALGAFLLGALAGGRIGMRIGGHRGRYLRAAAATSLLLVLAAIEMRRREGCPPVPPASRESAAIPVSVSVSTVVVRSGTASRRAIAFWTPIASASGAINP